MRIWALSCICTSKTAKTQQQEVVICLQVQIKSKARWSLVCLWFGLLNFTRGMSCTEFTERFGPEGLKKQPTSFMQCLYSIICHNLKFAVISNRQIYLFAVSRRTQSSRDVAAKQGFLFSLKFLAMSAGNSGLVVVCWLLPRHIYPWHGLRHNIYCLLIGYSEAQACPPWESSWDIQ